MVHKPPSDAHTDWVCGLYTLVIDINAGGAIHN